MSFFCLLDPCGVVARFWSVLFYVCVVVCLALARVRRGCAVVGFFNPRSFALRSFVFSPLAEGRERVISAWLSLVFCL